MAVAHVAQLVERILGKDEVHRFNPGRGLHLFRLSSVRYTRLIDFAAGLQICSGNRKYHENDEMP